MAGTTPGDEMVTVLDPDHPSVHLAALDAVVHGRVFADQACPAQPAADVRRVAAAAAEPAPATWRIGLVHGSIAIPGKTDHDEVVITTDEIAASGLDYLALGHWHSAQSGKAGGVTYAYAGAPEPVALDQDRAGKVLLVSSTNTQANGPARSSSSRSAGRRFEKLRDRRRDRRQPAGPRRQPRRPAPTPTSSSTSGWSASDATTSTSTSTRSRARSRRRSSRSACAMPRCRR